MLEQINLDDAGLIDIGELSAAARLLQDAREQPFAAQAEKLGLDERIFLLKSLPQSRRVGGADAGIDHQLGFFLGAFDECAAGIDRGDDRRGCAQTK